MFLDSIKSETLRTLGASRDTSLISAIDIRAGNSGARGLRTKTQGATAKANATHKFIFSDMDAILVKISIAVKRHHDSSNSNIIKENI